MIPKICFQENIFPLLYLSIENLRKLNLKSCCTFYEKINVELGKNQGKSGKKIEFLYIVNILI